MATGRRSAALPRIKDAVAQMTSHPYRVSDAAEQFDGASAGDLHRALSHAIDDIFFLRGISAWAATELERALEYKGFARSGRSFAQAQVGFLGRMAKGDAAGVMVDRERHHVERAAQREGIEAYLRRALPDLDTSGPKGENESLRVGLAYALQELLTLRQLLAYEAGVARAHVNPSGPKKVREILAAVDLGLLAAATEDLTDFWGLPERLRVVDRKAALRAVGADEALTNHAFLSEHGLSWS